MASQPNFIVFLTDDQGYEDLSCMGADDFATPHLDRLAAEGARFNCWYSNSSVCSPSRASLLTGRYPGNAGVCAILAGHRTATGLLPEVPTLASELKKQGYATGMSGKWHLGVAEGCRPHHHGFDDWFGFLAGCVDYYSHIFYWGMWGSRCDPVHDLWDNNEETWLNGDYLTEVITERAIAFIRRAVREDRPFFLYVPYNAPHYPMHAPRKYMDRFPDLPWERRIMAAMISAVDDGIGAIMAEVQRQGLADNTCTVFTSDNGPSRETRNWLDGTTTPYFGGHANGFRGHKGSLFDGGLRMPAIIHWPDGIPAGQVIDSPCVSMDVFPTLMAAAGADCGGLEVDGQNLLPLLQEGRVNPRGDIFWELGEQVALRRGDWKVVLHAREQDGAPPTEDVHLSNLAEDPGEAVNLKDREAERCAAMAADAEAWYASIQERWERHWVPAAAGVTALRT